MNTLRASSQFSASEASNLSKLTLRCIRTFARAGLVGAPRPGARGDETLFFDFQDITVLKTAARLVAEGFSPQRVYRSFVAWHRLVDDRPPSGTRWESWGHRLVAYDDGSAWEPETGQLRFIFERSGAKLIARKGKTSGDDPLCANGLGNPCAMEEAETWFDRALEHEDDHPTQAYQHYLRALACDPEHLESMVNIGRLCSCAGELHRAAAYFRQAVRIDPEHPVAQFNLAVTLNDLNDLDMARLAYEAAIAADPNFTDAHFNLAVLLDDLGDHRGARHHRLRYEQARQTDP